METHEHQNNVENIEISSSLSSSPSHEFSFTISQNNIFSYNNKSKTPSPHSFAVDLSPADDIFFHGHLLPLQILSHFSSSSPRSSTNSMDSFTLPIRELFSEDENINPTKDSVSSNNNSANSSANSSNNNNISTLDDDDDNKLETNNNIGETKVLEGKSKFNFSLFGSIKGSKGCRVKEKEDKEKKQKQKKLRFDVIHVVKKYFRMVKPLMIFRGQKGKIRKQSKSYSYSYSGSVTPRNKEELKGWNWRGQYSAPASMRNSPSNSGLLVATTPPFTPPSDSTMEDLQAAIQAAIAHCKNSFAKEENLKNANT